MNKIQVLVLYGGKSGEHEVSCRSASSICTHLDRERYSLTLCGINRSNRWFLQPPQVLKDAVSGGSPVRIEEHDDLEVYGMPGVGLRTAANERVETDIVFPVIHGTYGEDGTLQGFLETLGLAYTGSGVFASAACFDKRMTKQLCSAAGIPSVDSLSVHLDSTSHGVSEAVKQQVSSRWPGQPVFVKPARCGSSVGVSRVAALSGLPDALRVAARYDCDILIEPEIRGRELECAITGNDSITAHAVGEVQPLKGFYDYRTKYINEDGAALTIPALVEKSVYEDVQRIACDAYRACGCSGYARVDLFFSEETGDILLNEINTIPGFTSISMFPSLCQENGTGYSDLISLLIRLGIEQSQLRQTLSYDFSDMENYQ